MIRSDLKDKLVKLSVMGVDDYLEECNGAYIMRSSFYSTPHTMDEVIAHALSSQGRSGWKAIIDTHASICTS